MNSIDAATVTAMLAEFHTPERNGADTVRALVFYRWLVETGQLQGDTPPYLVLTGKAYE